MISEWTIIAKAQLYVKGLSLSNSFTLTRYLAVSLVDLAVGLVDRVGTSALDVLAKSGGPSLINGKVIAIFVKCAKVCKSVREEQKEKEKEKEEEEEDKPQFYSFRYYDILLYIVLYYVDGANDRLNR